MPSHTVGGTQDKKKISAQLKGHSEVEPTVTARSTAGVWSPGGR